MEVTSKANGYLLSDKSLYKLIFPLIIEQFLLVTVGLVDSIMIARAVKIFIIRIFILSTNDTADTADSPILAIIIESTKPTVTSKKML